MTVVNSLNKHTYIGNGATTEFPYTFKIFKTSDIQVILTDVATGTDETITTNYSVNIDDSTVTYPTSGTPLTSATKITLNRNVPITQETSLPNNGPYLAKTIESALDKGTIINQQQQEQIDRVLKLAISVDDGVSNELPSPVANQLIRWNSAGTELENTPPGEDYAAQAAASAATIGGFLNYSAIAKTSDIITKGPWSDVRAFYPPPQIGPDGTLHTLAERFSTLSEAQVLYPHATSLTDSIDWCAIQLAINTSNNVLITGDVGYYINKSINIISAKTIKGTNRYKTIIYQTSDNTPILTIQSWFHNIGNFSVSYVNQQISTNTNAVAIRLQSVCYSRFDSISIFNSCVGIAPHSTTASWNYTLSDIYVEGFSLSGIVLPKSSGVKLDNIFITKPYLIGYSGLELRGGDYIVINGLNIEGWNDNSDINYGQGYYQYPILTYGARVIINGLHMEAVTMAADNGFITTSGGSGYEETSNIIINQWQLYHIRLDSAAGITRACLAYTKHKTFLTVNGLDMALIVKDLTTLAISDVYNSLLITDSVDTRAEFTGVTGGTIVGTNDYNGTYGSAGFASSYTYVTNNDVNLGVALQKVNNTIYSQRFKLGITTPKVTLTNGGIGFTATEVPQTDPNTLDDYREGTWTPSLTFGGGNTGITYTTNTGVYTKIGRMVYFTMNMVLSSKGSSTGAAVIGGLPYNSVYKYSLPVVLNTTATINGHIQANTRNTSTKNIDLTVVSTGVSSLTDASFTNTTELIISGSYQV